MNSACKFCRCFVDINAPYALIRDVWPAHLDCADADDARDLGSIDLPERVLETFGEQHEQRH